MRTDFIKKKFEKMGARVSFLKSSKRNRTLVFPIEIDVLRDSEGEFFSVVLDDERNDYSLQVLDIDPKERQLLLMCNEKDSKGKPLKYLCGHDERQWYIATIPESAGAKSIKDAMEALKPFKVRDSQNQKRVKLKKRNKRKNETFIRQGEWFFVPVQNLFVDPVLILKNEPISRGFGSSPHIVEELYRIGGATVYVHPIFAPNGVTESQRSTLLTKLRIEGKLKRGDKVVFDTRQRDATVYAHGHVRHKDHKTVYLSDWHEVLMNSESQAKAAKSVVFLD